MVYKLGCTECKHFSTPAVTKIAFRYLLRSSFKSISIRSRGHELATGTNAQTNNSRCRLKVKTIPSPPLN